MKIELHEITIRDITERYVDNQENGVVGYKGLLNIRPKYQREFVYTEEKRKGKRIPFLLSRSIQHIFNKNPISPCWIID